MKIRRQIQLQLRVRVTTGSFSRSERHDVRDVSRMLGLRQCEVGHFSQSSVGKGPAQEKLSIRTTGLRRVACDLHTSYSSSRCVFSRLLSVTTSLQQYFSPLLDVAVTYYVCEIVTLILLLEGLDVRLVIRIRLALFRKNDLDEIHRRRFNRNTNQSQFQSSSLRSVTEVLSVLNISLSET